MDVVVVGAGIIGAATAFELTRSGATVTVVDADPVTRGASAATFGWVNANGKAPDHYFELNRAGMDAHAQLAAVLRDESWLHAGGSIEWSTPEGSASLRDRVATHLARGYPAEMIDRERLSELVPGLPESRLPDEAAFFPSEGWVDAVAVIDLLLTSAVASGAVLRRGLRVTNLGVGHHHRAEVIVDPLERLYADVVVNCAGADAGILAASTGLTLDTAGPAGLNAVTVPTAARPGRVVRAPGVHFRPETGGRVMIASPSTDATLPGHSDTAVLAARLVEAVAEYLPGLAGTAVDEVRVARRAIPPDGLPMIGRTSNAPWLYHVVTHSGVTLAPLLGRLVAAEILEGEDDASLSPYRPARFDQGEMAAATPQGGRTIP